MRHTVSRSIRAWVINRRKKRGSVTYSTDREDEVNKILTISLLCLTGLRTISIHEEGFTFLTHAENIDERVNLKSLQSR